MSDVEELELQLYLYKGGKEKYKIMKQVFPDRIIALKPLLEDLRKRKKYINELEEKVSTKH